MEKDIILHGVHIGEHSFESDKIIDEINERCIKPGFNFVTLRLGSPLRNDEIPQQNLIDWAKYLAENKIYFTFLYTVQHAPDGRSSFFDKETVLKMKEIAGDYFLGDMIGETGSSFACKMKGYFNLKDLSAGTDKSKIKIDYVDMKEAHEGYVESIKKYIATNKELEMPDILSVEATGLNKYNAEAGVTTMLLDEGVDTGAMLLKHSRPLDDVVTGGELFDLLAADGAALLSRTLEELITGTLVPIPQPEEGACYASMLNKSMCPLDWQKPARTLHNQVRGMNPWPVATCCVGGKCMKVYTSRVGEATDAAPGTVVCCRPLTVACGDGYTLILEEIQMEGSRRMAAADYLCGHPIDPGTLLG